jgi:hypothetical protein
MEEVAEEGRISQSGRKGKQKKEKSVLRENIKLPDLEEEAEKLFMEIYKKGESDFLENTENIFAPQIFKP